MVVSVDLHPPLVAAMLRPEAYPHPVESVRFEQTHVSWLFFTGRVVYKVKKPVDLGFLDFTTLERRRRYCELEVSLNSRLSPEVYDGVSEIRLCGGEFLLDAPSGQVIDYAVRMKQLDRRNSLDERLASDRATEADMRRIAAKVAAFHQQAATGPSITRLGDWSVVRCNALENLQQLLPFTNGEIPISDLCELEAYTRAFLKAKAPLFRNRAQRGRILDGHGDLHSANIFLEEGEVQIIDCIEFNDRFRCLDPVEDIAFLAMDLDYFGRPDLSQSFVDEYQRLRHDSGLPELLDFFKIYRALVRTKINCLLLADKELEGRRKGEVERAVRGYFELARAGVRNARQLPAVIAFGGLAGTGKTTLSGLLCQRWGGVHLSSDAIRKQLAGVPAGEHRYEAFERGIYAPEFTRKTYRRMLDMARRELRRGNAVFLDASFLREADRVAARALAKSCAVPFYFVQCVTPQSELKTRIRKRTTASGPNPSDARLSILLEQTRRWEPVQDAGSRWIRLRTDRPVEAILFHLMEEIFERAGLLTAGRGDDWSGVEHGHTRSAVPLDGKNDSHRSGPGRMESVISKMR